MLYRIIFILSLAGISLTSDARDKPVYANYDSLLPKVILHPAYKISMRDQLAWHLSGFMERKQAAHVVLSYTKGGRPIDVYYFPGISEERAMLIGGVHGSELSSIEVVKETISRLATGEKPYYQVLVIPILFPDNAATAERLPQEIGSQQNIGRYTANDLPDPNRQMPSLGKAFEELNAIDHAGRPIELENTHLLQLIQLYKPSRIASVHAIRNIMQAGIFADPRTDCQGIAIGYHFDSTLAINMAQFIQTNGGQVPGNQLNTIPTSLYHTDPAISERGQYQPRNIHGNAIPGNKCFGISLGSWASTATCDETGKQNRKACILFTVEFPGSKRLIDYKEPESKAQFQRNLTSYAAALVQIFLQQRETDIL
ncbi:MAG TPA: hypothetical protein VHK91_16185 [Flavisolibacter sp.]|jgi:hypothetical protein|nr:hypothetical protein [Flavisolibacter sp.]